jgi:MerR family copper efflux transcriptional regulator
MDTGLTIGTLSKKVDLPTKTIRFYEDKGLISSPKRLENGYRVYEDAVVDELKLIKYVRDLGLPIKEIKKLMLGCSNKGCAHTKEYLLSEIDTYLGLLGEKEKQMAVLKNKLKKMKNSISSKGLSYNKNPKFCCNILGQLSEMEKGGD